MMKGRIFLLFLALCLVVSLSVSAVFTTQQPGAARPNEPDEPDPKERTEKRIYVYVDEVTLSRGGDPPPDQDHQDPGKSLHKQDGDDASLGCGGVLVVKFVEHVLIDGPGNDLKIYELGKENELLMVEISKDGKTWINLGNVRGPKIEFDLAGIIKPREAIRYVRLTDLKSDCSGAQAGADIDAVAAMNWGVQINIQASVLFAFDKFDIKPEAAKILHDVALQLQKYPGATIIIEGHTCSMGALAYNQKLSENRAKSVHDYLINVEKLADFIFEVRGLGETSPIAPNDTEANREKNRRVEILVIPLVEVGS